MIRSLTIQGFRAFQEVQLNNLGRVNLIVGRNNSGKTSVLEAVQLLVSEGYLPLFRDQFSRRRELFIAKETNRVYPRSERIRRATVERLFHEGRAGTAASFTLAAQGSETRKMLGSVAVEEKRRTEEPLLTNETWVLSLLTTYENGKTAYRWDVGEGWSISLGRADVPRGRNHEDLAIHNNLRFVTTASLSRKEIIKLFKRIALSPEEQFATSALKIIEPNLDRLAVGSITPVDPYWHTTGRVQDDMLSLTKKGIRMPFGSHGEGMWRILGLTLALIHSRGGYLLVDDIDTGLHYTAMGRIWQVLDEGSRKHNVQIFATTHSKDCVDALASICKNRDSVEHGISIQRVERGKSTTVAYTEEEILAAAEHGVEVR